MKPKYSLSGFSLRETLHARAAPCVNIGNGIRPLGVVGASFY